jgi:hypothetical protein
MNASSWSSVCVACGAPRERGVLCAACARGLVDEELCAEQVVSRVPAPLPGMENAWLIDGFGFPHTVAVPTTAPSHLRTVQLGRGRDSDVQVCDRTVSQTHALLEHRPLSNAWFVVDAGADNGVFVGADRVPRRFPLERGDRLFLGRRAGFLFIPLDAADLPAARADVEWLRATGWTGDTVGDDSGEVAVPIRVHAVTEGGAVCVIGRERVALSELEYELLLTLHRRFVDDEGKDDAVRGFVPAAQLLEALSWRSEAPTHGNLRGLVKKLRKKLADRDPPVDVIASQQGLGYRLARPLIVD